MNLKYLFLLLMVAGEAHAADVAVPSVPAAVPAGITDTLLGVTGGTTVKLFTISNATRQAMLDLTNHVALATNDLNTALMAIHNGPFTNSTLYGNSTRSNWFTMTPTNAFFTNTAGGSVQITNGNIIASGTISSVSNSIPLTNDVCLISAQSAGAVFTFGTSAQTNDMGPSVTLPSAGVWRITFTTGQTWVDNLTSAPFTNWIWIRRTNNTAADTYRAVDCRRIVSTAAGSYFELPVASHTHSFLYTATAGDALAMRGALLPSGAVTAGNVQVRNAWISAEWVRP